MIKKRSNFMSGFEKYFKIDHIGSKLGMYAEKYMKTDPNGSMLKQGMLLEYIISLYLKVSGLYDFVVPKPRKKQIDLDDMLSFLKDDLNQINPQMYDLCNRIRKNRNSAAHEFFDDENIPVETLPNLKKLYFYIFDYFERTKTSISNSLYPATKSQDSDKNYWAICEPETGYTTKNEALVEVFEQAFKNALTSEALSDNQYEWINILIEWCNTHRLVNGKLGKKVRQREEGKEFSFKEHLQGMIYALLSNQTNWGRNIAPRLHLIDGIFHNYDVEFIKSKNGSYFEEKIRSINCGNRQIKRQMQDLNYNISILEKIADEYGSLDNFVTAVSVSVAIKELAHGKYKLKNMSDALVSEYLRNVGFNEVKPDIHMKRFFGSNRMGSSTHRLATEKEVFDICKDIENKTGIARVLIDEAIWNFCRASNLQVCGETPQCDRCPIRQYCTQA